MIKTVQLLWIGMAAVLLVAGQNGTVPARPIGYTCSGFSEEQDHRSPALSWRFRACSSSEGPREVHIQFRNRSNQRLAFEFRLWTERMRSCRSDRPPVVQGRVTLASHEVQDWPYTVAELKSEDDFNGRVWVCVREMTS